MSKAQRALLHAVYHGRLDEAKIICQESDVADLWNDDFEPLRVALLSPKLSADVVDWCMDCGRERAFQAPRDGLSPAALALAINAPENITGVIIGRAKTPEEILHFTRWACRLGRERETTRLAGLLAAETTLPHASELRKNLSFAQCFHKMKIDPEVWNRDWQMDVYVQSLEFEISPWHAAAFVGYKAPFSGTIAEAVLLDNKDRNALMYAIDGRAGHDVDFISFLLSSEFAGSAISAPFLRARASDNFGTALHFCCRLRKRVDVIKFLLNAPGIDCDAIDGPHRRTPLHTALGCCIELEAVKALDAAGCDFLRRCAAGWPGLFYLLDGIARDEARQPGRKDKIKEHEDILSFVLSRHIALGDVDLRSGDTKTALMLACLLNLPSSVECILNAVPSMSALMERRDTRWRTAYHWACERNSGGALEVLKKYNLLSSTILDMVDDTGKTGAELLIDAVHIPRKHHTWPNRITELDVYPEIVPIEDVMATVVAARAKYAKAFIEDGARAMKLRTCASCLSYVPNALKCGRCKMIHYCNANCQKRDWHAHKLACAPPQTVAQALAEGARLTKARAAARAPTS